MSIVRLSKTVKLVLLFLALSVIVYFFLHHYSNKDNKEVLTIYGNVDIRDVALSFRVFGRISQLNYEEGDRVKQGDVVAVLDKEPYAEDIALSKAQLAQAKANLTNQEKLYKRTVKLVEAGGASQTDLDNALSARDQAKASVDAAQAQLEKSMTNYSDTEIHAPTHGIILTRVREPGAVVAAGGTVYNLMLDQPIWIRTYVDEPSLGFIYPGQKATVTTDSGGQYEGFVGFISPQAEFTPKTVETRELRTDLVYRLRVIIDHPDEGLRQGMPVTVKIHKRAPK